MLQLTQEVRLTSFLKTALNTPWETLKLVIQHQLQYKTIYGVTPSPHNNQHNLRHANYRLPWVRANYRAQKLAYLIPAILNNHPAIVDIIETSALLHCFKNNIKPPVTASRINFYKIFCPLRETCMYIYTCFCVSSIVSTVCFLHVLVT